MKKAILIFLLVVGFSPTLSDIMTITYRPPLSERDTRHEYSIALVRTAMEKTHEEYGDFEIVPTLKMNLGRASLPNYIETLENFIFETSVTKERNETLLPIKIPLHKGLFGYRLFLIDSRKQEEFSQISNLEELKKYSIGQEKSWTDVEILEYNDFKVVKGISYEGLFGMLMLGRFDLFSRGPHEAFVEQEARPDIKNLSVEKTLCLYYPLPRYFYTSKKNTLLAERLEKGLTIMINDGSFDKIWLEYHGDTIKKADFSNRKIFKIKNPLLPDDIPFDNESYWFDPEK